MAEQNLLNIVQNILASMSSDEVNSISDTPESLQVANIVQNKYYDIVSRGDLPEHNQLFQLQSSQNVLQPTLMYIPSGICKMEWLKYFDTNALDNEDVDQFGAYSHDLNTDIVSSPAWASLSTTSHTIGLGTFTFTVQAGLPVVNGQGVTATANPNIGMGGAVVSYSGTTLVMQAFVSQGTGTFNAWTLTGNATLNASPGYKYVTILPTKQFFDMVNSYNPQDPDVQSFTFSDTNNNYPSSYTLYYKTDAQPKHCTVLSNYYVLFDSYDNTQDTTLQSSKTMAFGQVVPSFSLTDSFVPDLNDQQFPLLLNEAKVLAFYELKQQSHPIADREVKRQWSSVQRNKSIADKPSYFDQIPSFGRAIGSGGYAIRRKYL